MNSLAVLLIFAASAFYMRKIPNRWLHLLLVMSLFIPVAQNMIDTLAQFSKFTPERYDEWFFTIDQSLFGCPSFAIGRVLESEPWLKRLVIIDYRVWTLVAMLAVASNFALLGIRRGYTAYGAMILSCCGAVPIYALLPASGPRFAFASFPFTAPTLTTHHVLHLFNSPANCLPSVHMVLALLASTFIWRWFAGRLIAVIHVTLTILATLGLGEHYLIDLIAAVPYTMFILWVVNYFASINVLRLTPYNQESIVNASITKA